MCSGGPLGANGRSAIDAYPSTEAYNIVDKNGDGTVETFRLFKAARSWTGFDSMNYGKEKISPSGGPPWTFRLLGGAARACWSAGWTEAEEEIVEAGDAFT